MPTSWTQRTTLVLALTVYPLTEICCQPVSEPSKSTRRNRSYEKKKKPNQPSFDRPSVQIFDNMPWHTVKMLMGLLDSVQDGLNWFGACMPPGVSDLDTKHMRTGKDLLDRLNDDHLKLEKDVTVLKGELKATRESLVALSRENKALKHKLYTSREAGLILEQDRKQLQALLEDKCRLQEENSRLEREIEALHELLEYAAEHVVEELGSQMFDEDVRIDAEHDHGVDPPVSSSEIRMEFPVLG